MNELHTDPEATGNAPATRGRGTGTGIGTEASTTDGRELATASPASAPGPRPGTADPVKALMNRHHDLCARAVDHLEIAAGLEAHGVTDRTAARFRHRDVFSLAEEMYARFPRDPDAPPPHPAPAPAHRPGTGRPAPALLALLPGLLCAATVVAARSTAGRSRLALAVLGTLLVGLAVRTLLRRGPLAGPHRAASGTRGWTFWLLTYAFLGDGLLGEGLTGGPDGPWSPATAPLLALALACAPAVWCAGLFTALAGRRLGTSRALDDFAASARPVLLGAFALFLGALLGLLALCGTLLGEHPAYAGAGALGALLLLARLLTAHGFPHAPAVALATAGAAEGLSLATVFASRLPGCSLLSVPVQTVTDAWGAGSVPALACGTAATVLLLHATRTLTRASAHAVPHEPR
ncbi:hypothetical protein [Streptomyces sp. C1-2]|uniref:hypothetical protein n=1 Tax=Streptomyces sp. C1-2 TaxID=2720022 RepID=UPI0014323C20|nr:hypothetical protein [Streptomyces sp. C1-2]NJP73991.1 hypothetical protein [Streptomyces sp. C1-2]